MSQAGAAAVAAAVAGVAADAQAAAQAATDQTTQDALVDLLVEKEPGADAAADTVAGDQAADDTAAVVTKEPEADAGATAVTTADTSTDATAAADAAAQGKQGGTAAGEEAGQMRTDLSVAMKALDALTAKVEAGQQLTRTEQQQASHAKRTIETVRERMAAKDFDPIEHAGVVAESLLETDQTVQTLQQQNADLVRRLAAVESNQRQQDVASTWAQLGSQYPKVDVQAVWKKSLQDTAENAGVDPAKVAGTPVGAVLQNMATKLFHTRAGDAVKSQAGKAAATTTPTAQGKTAAAVAKPPVTPGGARVTSPTPPAVTNSGVLDEDAAYLQTSASLVV